MFEKIQIKDIKKPKRPVFKVFIHCSDSDNPAHDNAETIDKWHKERGWQGIGYHFYLQKDGDLQVGRSLEKIPAAQKEHNTGSIAICCGGRAKDKFTKVQMAALKALCLHMNKLYGGGVTFHGHCEVEPNKECPVFDYKTVLNLNKDGFMPY